MNISENWLKTGDQIVSYLEREFGHDIVNGSGGIGSKKWYMDQELVSWMLFQWKDKK
jgi:hypothetical protein